MNIKENWINEFMAKLREYDEAYIADGQYAFQIAVAYFDWAGVDEPEYTVEEAFARFVSNQSFS